MSALKDLFARYRAASPATRLLIAGLGLMLVLSIARIITGADDLTSSGTISSTMRVATPILLAGLAGLWAERAGIVNIGIEGMMILGSWLGGLGGEPQALNSIPRAPSRLIQLG